MLIASSIRLSEKYGVNATIPSCFWCGNLKKEVALLGKYGGRGQDLEAPMGILLDYEPCDECLENRKLGVTLMEVTTSENFDNQPEIQKGIYPTGKWCIIRKQAAERMFSGYLNGKDALFVEKEIYQAVTGGNAVT